MRTATAQLANFDAGAFLCQLFQKLHHDPKLMDDGFVAVGWCGVCDDLLQGRIIRMHQENPDTAPRLGFFNKHITDTADDPKKSKRHPHRLESLTCLLHNLEPDIDSAE